MRIARIAASLSAISLATVAGCQAIVESTDRDVAAAIKERQQRALEYQLAVPPPDKGQAIPTPERGAFDYAPNPSSAEVPPDFKVVRTTLDAATSAPSSQPSIEGYTNALDIVTYHADGTSTTSPATTTPVPGRPGIATSQPLTRASEILTLSDALAYALKNRREYMSAKEDLYVSALNLTLERHLWTPQFAAEYRMVYGNYGENQNFDQAMRFVQDLSMSQRLPYGGQFTASVVSTLIRDVKKTITASEGSAAVLGLNVPLLRGAGHVADEQLTQLERELTYSVRTFERFRRSQLVDVAATYFELLRSKQLVIDTESSLKNFVTDFQRAQALEESGTGTLLDTQRAEQAMLSAENDLEESRERFRAAADLFKIFIGMPVDEPLRMQDVEDIEAIENQIIEGRYPLLVPPPAVNDEERSLQVALQYRLDLLTLTDRIGDAKRGVEISANALLPDLNVNTTLAMDTDPERYSTTLFTYGRANWRSELVLGLPIERTRERVNFRESILRVRQADRDQRQQVERIRAEVRRAANQLRLTEKSLDIQRRNLNVADSRREYAQIQFDQGDIGYRDKLEAENEWTNARNRLNTAKTDRWIAILGFRLSTETLRVDDDGAQIPDPE